MTARQLAEQDIRKDLSRQGKSFLAFRSELNPVMRHLVRQQLREQSIANPFTTPSHTNSQLVARCFFCNGEVTLHNYDRYYGKK